MYTGDPLPDYPRQINDISDMEKLKTCIDGYDCGIKYMDEHIGKILDFLDKNNLTDDTAIIVTSDHGENFGELGIYSEHGTADNITCRIPMIIKWPGMLEGHVDNNLQYNFDLAPTLSDLLHTKPWEKWVGKSYAETLKTGENINPRSELILSQNAHVCQRAVRWDNWIYIKTYHDGFHPHFDDEMLFDLLNDPHETANLAKEYPQMIKTGAEKLDTWREEMIRTMPFGYSEDPMDIVLNEGGPHHANALWIPIEKYKKRLETTGRAHWIAKLAERHPEF